MSLELRSFLPYPNSYFAIAAIGLEASGGYERGPMRALLAAGLTACQVNPFKLRQFARASGVLAKNDPLDTRMIASFVAIMPTRPAQPRPPAIERLAEMLAVRRQLNAEKVAAENASRLLEDAMLQRLSRRRIARLAADIDMLDRTWSRLWIPTPRSSIATNCSPRCRESDRCWRAR
jgi:transposase